MPCSKLVAWSNNLVVEDRKPPLKDNLFCFEAGGIGWSPQIAFTSFLTVQMNSRWKILDSSWFLLLISSWLFCLYLTASFVVLLGMRRKAQKDLQCVSSITEVGVSLCFQLPYDEFAGIMDWLTCSCLAAFQVPQYLEIKQNPHMSSRYLSALGEISQMYNYKWGVIWFP